MFFVIDGDKKSKFNSTKKGPGQPARWLLLRGLATRVTVRHSRRGPGRGRLGHGRSARCEPRPLPLRLDKPATSPSAAKSQTQIHITETKTHIADPDAARASRRSAHYSCSSSTPPPWTPRRPTAHHRRQLIQLEHQRVHSQPRRSVGHGIRWRTAAPTTGTPTPSAARRSGTPPGCESIVSSIRRPGSTLARKPGASGASSPRMPSEATFACSTTTGGAPPPTWCCWLAAR